jgi:chitinase
MSLPGGNPIHVRPSETGKLEVSDPVKIAAGLPRHILIGYWHNWDNTSAAFMRLRDVVSYFDVINIAFAVPSQAGDGEILFAPHDVVNGKEFKSDILHLQSLGKKVLISIGGAGSSISIEDVESGRNFIDSITAIIREYKFDGMDINLEGKIILDPGDTDFRNPISANIRHLITALREIRNNFGPDFILSMAPETINVQAALNLYSGVSGSYLPLIHDLRDILTYLQVQHYNSSPLAGLDGNTYMPGTADFHAAMAEMLLHGFPVYGSGDTFPPLKPEQIVIGMAAFPDAVSDGYTAPAEVQKVLNYLTSGESFGGMYVRQSPGNYSSLRGIMTWSINWDAANHHHVSSTIRSHLDTLS